MLWGASGSGSAIYRSDVVRRLDGALKERPETIHKRGIYARKQMAIDVDRGCNAFVPQALLDDMEVRGDRQRQ